MAGVRRLGQGHRSQLQDIADAQLRHGNAVFLRHGGDGRIFQANKDPVLVRHTISKETSDIIKDYMRGVVEEGTAKTAAVEGYDVGGKTGTAEKLPRGNGKYLVSFIGYAPQENPQVMVYVVIDEPNVDNQANSKLATTMASQIMTEIFPYLGVEKSADAKAADAKSSDSSASSDSSGDTPDDMATESGDGE